VEQVPDVGQGVQVEPETAEFVYLVWALRQDAARVAALSGGQELAREMDLPAAVQAAPVVLAEMGCEGKPKASVVQGIRETLAAVLAWFR
jgi:hypothetical protein